MGVKTTVESRQKINSRDLGPYLDLRFYLPTATSGGKTVTPSEQLEEVQTMNSLSNPRIQNASPRLRISASLMFIRLV